MKSSRLLLIVALFSILFNRTFSQTNTFPASGSTGIGTVTPNASAILDLSSTTQGLLIPRMSQAQRNAIVSPATGLLIYQTNGTKGLYAYGGGAWTAVTAKGWGFTGNAGINPTTNFLGTTDTNALAFRTNNIERMRILKTGLIGIGTSSPLFNLDVTGTGRFTSSLKVGNYTLPSADGTPGQILKTDGAGVLTWSNDNNDTYSAGAGISIVTNVITNTTPDQVVTLNGTGATTVTGSYPNFTINSTDLNTTYSAGTGISVASNVITNTSPDQVVTLSGTGATSVTGAYPNFTINSTDLNTTYSAGAGISIAGGIITNTGDTNAGNDITNSSTAGGDVSGTFATLSVNKMKGVNVSSIIPTNSQVLKYNSGTLSWEPATDLNTTYSAGTGINIASGVISNTGDTNAGDDVTTASTAGGDASGTFSSLSVNKIKGVSVSSTAPTNAQVLKYNSGTLNWEPAADANTTYTAGTGITLTGTVFSNKLSTGAAGGQTVYGGNAAGNNLTLSSTSNSAKGKILFGGSFCWDELNGKLGIGTASPTSALHVYSGGVATLAGTGFIMLGNPANTNLVMDNQILQARSNGAASTLYLNYYGGDTKIGGAGSGTFEVADGGNIGIGTLSSTQKVNIQGTTSSTANVLYVQSNYNGGNSNVVGINSVSEIADGYGIGLTASGGYKGAQGTANAGAYTGTAYGVLGFANGTAGTRVGVYGTASGGATNWAGYFVGNTYVSGDLNIGNASGATGYKLSINGKLICTEARVATYATWPDFVFKNDYPLMPLSELEQRIKSENHLPGFPSALEVECEGFEMGNMQAKLLQKIEELSLYMIDLNKQNEELKARIDKLENK